MARAHIIIAALAALAVFIALPSSAAGESALRAAAPRALQEEGVCSFDVEVDNCSFNRIKNAVDNPACDFSDDIFKADIKRACRAARRAADAGTSLSDYIEDWDDTDLNEYFNGHTAWNYRTGPLEDEAPIVGEIFDDHAQTSTISFPTEFQNFGGCQYRSVVCVWIRDRQANDDNGNCNEPYDTRCRDSDPADNTDLCYADASRLKRAVHVPEGVSFWPEDSEGAVHAHGFAWGGGSVSSRFRGNLLFYISMYDHMYQRGYVENVPLAPMCGCIEHMPTISRADCTEVDVEETWRVTFDGSAEDAQPEAERTEVNIEYNACDGSDQEGGADNDLYSEIRQRYRDEVPEEVEQFLVGPVDNNDESNCPQGPEDL